VTTQIKGGFEMQIKGGFEVPVRGKGVWFASHSKRNTHTHSLSLSLF
jgi:hypothetical protein